MCLQEDRSDYTYICTHVDGVKVINTNPKMWNDPISVHTILETTIRSMMVKRFRLMAPKPTLGRL